MRAKCECKVCGGIMDAKRNEDNQPIYECRCCYGVFTRKVYNTKAKQVKATKQDSFNSLIDELLNN